MELQVHQHFDTQMTAPAYCAKLQTTFSQSWNRKTDGQTMVQCGNTRLPWLVKPMLAHLGGGGGMPPPLEYAPPLHGLPWGEGGGGHCHLHSCPKPQAPNQ